MHCCHLFYSSFPSSISFISFHISPFMDLQKPKITEIQVRIDCNGCVQKIKKALHGINGIYDVYIDFPQQKLTIIGWADPERIVKAIRKTRKIATICSHTEQPDPAAQPTDPPPPEEGAANPPPPEAPPAEASGPPAEPPKDQPPPENPQPQPHPPENQPPPPPPPPHVAPSQVAMDTNAGQAGRPIPNIPGPRGVQEAYVTYHPSESEYTYRYGYNQGYGGHWNGHPREPAAPVTHHHPSESDYTNRYGYNQGYGGHWNVHPREPAAPVTYHHPSESDYNYRHPQEPAAPVPPNPNPNPSPSPSPICVTHSYNTYRPSPYVTEYENLRSPPTQPYYSRNYHYSNEYHDISSSSSSSSNYNNGNGNITSIFSDENPNACTII